MSEQIQLSPEINTALDLLNNTNKSLFITGKAGTGKTTFLKYALQHCNKNIVVAAPTGVAAINAGGVTLHSFFNLPFGPYIPQATTWGAQHNNTSNLIAKVKYNINKINILQELDVLVIDEVSMVRADVLDMIDAVLKHYRKQHHLAFGGVQLLFIGDLYQLPPVVKEDEKILLSNYYASEYFFDAAVMQQCTPICIELKTIYRQQQLDFIELLNAVRNNMVSQQHLQALNARYQAQYSIQQTITLTTHNYQANEINSKQLNLINNKELVYKAIIEGEFAESSYPADEYLTLKIGAKVMFIKNDNDEKKYYNGKIGVITHADKTSVTVIDAEGNDIEVNAVAWDNIRYKIDGDSNHIKENKIGSFKQLPLRLAWAVTIHKSQGLTFNEVAINAAKSFAPGQLYVALSRCTTLQGITLTVPLNANNLIANTKVVAYMQANSASINSQQVQQLMQQSVLDILSELYNFNSIQQQYRYLLRISNDYRAYITQQSHDWLNRQVNSMEYLHKISSQFANEIKAGTMAYDLIASRGAKAHAHFAKELGLLIDEIINHHWNCDNQEVSKALEAQLQKIVKTLHFKTHIFTYYNTIWQSSQYFEAKASVPKANYKIPVSALASKQVQLDESIAHPILYMQLAELRLQICTQGQIPPYRVLTNAALQALCTYLPFTLKDLQFIKGFGQAKIHQYGSSFLHIIEEYCAQENLPSNIDALKFESKLKKQKPEQDDKIAKSKDEKMHDKLNSKSSTYFKSYDLFNIGLSIEQIAQERGLSSNTISDHLSEYVKNGTLKATQFMNDNTFAVISKAFEGTSLPTELKPIKDKLGDDYSYNDIRIVMNQLIYNNLQ
jgi:hypothetical protein